MANYGADTNSAQFFVTFKPTPHLNNKHVVFGRVQEGFEVLQAVEKVGTKKGNPTNSVKIVACGLENDKDDSR